MRLSTAVILMPSSENLDAVFDNRQSDNSSDCNMWLSNLTLLDFASAREAKYYSCAIYTSQYVWVFPIMTPCRLMLEKLAFRRCNVCAGADWHYVQVHGTLVYRQYYHRQLSLADDY